MPTRKTLLDLKYAVAGFLNRQTNTFVVNGRDNLLTAVNNAKDFIQRAIDFEYAKVSVLVPNVDLVRGGTLDNAILFEEEFGSPAPGTFPQPFYGPSLAGLPVGGVCPSPSDPPPCQPPNCYDSRTPPQYPFGPYGPNGGDKPCWPLSSGKHYPRTFSPFGNGLGSGGGDHGGETNSFCDSAWIKPRTTWSADVECWEPPPRVDLKRVLIGYLPFIDNTGVAPMTIYSKQEWADRRRRLAYEFTSLRISEAKALLAATGFGIIMDGKRFFVDPQSPQVFGWQSALNVYFDGIRWLEDFHNWETCQSHQQFLLDYCFDILMYRAIKELNFFLKEDERVGLSDKEWLTAWNNVIQWNATIFGNTTDVSLD